MGFFSDRRKRKEEALKKKQIEERTNKYTAEFVEKIRELNEQKEAASTREEELEIREKMVKSLDELLENLSAGTIELPGIQNLNSTNQDELVINYFKNLGVDLSTAFSDKKGFDLCSRLINCLYCKNNDEEYVSIVQEILRFRSEGLSPEEKKEFESMSRYQHYLEIKSFLEDNYLPENPLMSLNRVFGRIFKEEEILAMRSIYKATNKLDKLKIYLEFVRDFYGGKEEPDYSIVDSFHDEDFVIEYKKMKKCQKYGVPFDSDIPVIYEVTSESKAQVEEENERRSKIRLENGQMPAHSDYAMVRTTNGLPRYGYVETSYRYVPPVYMSSPFSLALKEAGIDSKPYKLAYLRTRQTNHWTLNCLVSGHAYGNFENRDYIIIEPLEEHLDDEGLLNVHEADTYFGSDVKLSDRAIILMPVESYKEKIKDPKIKAELDKYDVRLFVGEEEAAVEMVLQEEGYIYGRTGAWGYGDSRASAHYRSKYELVLHTGICDMADEYHVKSGHHSFSKIYDMEKQDEAKSMKNSEEHLAEALSEVMGLTSSNQQLLERLEAKEVKDKSDSELNRSIDLPVRDEKTGKVRYLTVLTSDILEVAGPEKILEATRIANARIRAQCDKYREEKDAILQARVQEAEKSSHR